MGQVTWREEYLTFGHVKGTGRVARLGGMATPIQTTDVEAVQALVQLLKNRSYEEIRQRMYDNPPGSTWWSACKTELDTRNGEQMAAALVSTSRVLEKMRGSTEHFEQLTVTLHETTVEIARLIEDTKQASRRLEIAVYVITGVTVALLFNVAFLVLTRK